MILLQNVFAQDTKDEEEICLTVSKKITYIDQHLKSVKKSTKITKSSETFQKLSESFDRSISLSTSMSLGIEFFDIGNAPCVNFAWKKTKDKELSTKNFFEQTDTEEVEYSENSRQLFKKETFTFEISRKLKGRTVKSSISEYTECNYHSPVPTAPELGCAQPNPDRLKEMATKEIKLEKAKYAPNATVTGTYDDTLSETRCGNDRKYIINFSIRQTFRITTYQHR